MSQTKPVALVTGASSGLGAEFARQLAARGYDLILVARRRDRMEQLAASLPTHARVLESDLQDRAQRAEVSHLLQTDSRLEMLVNNAGFGSRRRFWEADIEGQRAMHEVHVMAAMELTHAALGPMVARRKGAVINVASVAAFARSPANVSYCATKTWMTTFTEALALDLASAESPVKVQALCPGFTYTEFHDVLAVDRSRMAPPSLWMSAKDVVAASLQGLDRNQLFVIPGWRYRLFASVFPHLPLTLRMALQRRSPHTRERL